MTLPELDFIQEDAVAVELPHRNGVNTGWESVVFTVEDAAEGDG